MLSWNVMVVIEAPCWQPVKVGTMYNKATHQLRDIQDPAELLTELIA